MTPEDIARGRLKAAQTNRRRKFDRLARELRAEGWAVVPPERVRALVDDGSLPLTDAPQVVIDRILVEELTTSRGSGVN